MNREVLIKVENLSKKFCRSLRRSLWYGVCDIASELNLSRPLSIQIESDCSPDKNDQPIHRLREGEFWALRDVSFELRRGECLGLIGRNGAGKTTLLRLLSGLIKPDAGRIEMRGQIAAMIALGAGFNPVLTGRENIYVAGSLRGMTKREIDAKLDEIIDFSEIGEFIDSPVQSYSSGMQVRLGFSVAVSLRPDILLIDEVLAVGDASFKLKAFNAISKIIEDAAVIFVSHSITQVTKVCNRALLLSKGVVTAESKHLGEVIDAYLERVSYGPTRLVESPRAVLTQLLLFTEDMNVPSVIMSPSQRCSSRDDIHVVRYRQPLALEMIIDLAADVRRFQIMIEFRDVELHVVAQCSSINDRGPLENQSPHPTHLRLELPTLLLGKGHYLLNLWISEEHSRGIRRGEVLVAYEGILEIKVAANSVLFGGAPVQFKGQWRIKKGEPCEASKPSGLEIRQSPVSDGG